MVRGAEDPAHSHSAWPPHAERARGEFQREVSRRVFERELVSHIDGRTAEGGTMASRIQPGTSAQQLGVSDTHRVCGPGSFAVQMIPIAGTRAVKAHDELAALGLDRPPCRQNPRQYDGEGAG